MEKLIETFQASSCPEVWLKAVLHLLSCAGHERFNLSLAIETPEKMSASDKLLFETVDNFLIAHGEKPLTTVVGTIFPANYYLREGIKGVFEKFPKDYNELGPQGGWGTYAIRMIERKTAGGTFNPLQELIEKIKRLQIRNRSAYEINIMDNIFDLPIYRTESDFNRHMRQPCLSHLTFKIYPDQKLTLAVMYRSHYYVTKALGNLVGLAQLQSFVAAETELEVGPLICHSTHARIDTGKKFGLVEVKNLIAECSAIMN